MFLPRLNNTHFISRGAGWGARLASYVAAVAAGAVGLALWRRASDLGVALRRTAARPVMRLTHPALWPASLANAGWAEIVDAEGAVLGRARVMLAAAGQPSAEGQTVSGELLSLRLASGTLRLFPGRYWIRFEPGQNPHAIEVTTTPGNGRTDGVAIRWDDIDLPASLVERDAN